MKTQQFSFVAITRIEWELNLLKIVIPMSWFTARRRLSKSLSPDKDTEAQNDTKVNTAPDPDIANNVTDDDYPVGKPLEVRNNFTSLNWPLFSSYLHLR